MFISESWLREFVNIELGIEDLASKLTLAGLEVASISQAGPVLCDEKFVLGQIIEIAPHPSADKLKVCQVDIGKRQPLQIVCGAANVRVGLNTAVAMVGAKLGEKEIKTIKLRGVTSSGMLCSAKELSISEASDGIMELDQNVPIGGSISKYLGLQDTVIEIELTPNRGDCFSVLGVAREVAVLTGVALCKLTVNKQRVETNKKLSVQLKAVDYCPKFVGRVIHGIDMLTKSPDWLVEKLRRSGMRSINPIVDVTNFVMHEIGQPMHAFDMDKIQGGIIVRRAQTGEKLTLLDNSDIELNEDNLVIADHEKAIALAGIMGGDNSAISGSTRNIFLEAAFFAPDNIQGKARMFGMQTDASQRFERGVDFEMPSVAIERATELIIQIAGGKAGPVVQEIAQSALPRCHKISLSKTQLKRVLNISVPVAQVSQIFKHLGMLPTKTKSGWSVTSPSWRFDIAQEHDLVEEVARCFGYDQIPIRMPSGRQSSRGHKETTIHILDLKQTLIARGFSEAICYSFVASNSQKQLIGNTKAIHLANPISENMAVMRQSLWPGLIEVVQTNLRRKNNRIKVFEIGHVFSTVKNSLKEQERNRVGGVITGPVVNKQWGQEERTVDFFDLKGDVQYLLSLTGKSADFSFRSVSHYALHPGQSAEILFQDEVIGYIGKLGPAQQRYFEINQAVFVFEMDVNVLLTARLPAFSNISRFPAVNRDLALIVENTMSSTAVIREIRLAAGPLLKDCILFDVYNGGNIGENTTSFAFSLTFQSKSSNLAASDIDSITEQIITHVSTTLGAKLRV